MMWMTKKDKMEKEAFENQIFGNLATSYREAVEAKSNENHVGAVEAFPIVFTVPFRREIAVE